MAMLKQVIKYTNANAIEATWVDENDEVIRSHAYADVQMQMFRDDVVQFGGDIAEYESLISEVEAGIQPVEPTPVIVPNIISMRQCRLQLLSDGDLSNVTTLVSTLGDEVQIEWEYETAVNRNSILFQSIATALNKTSEECDNFFINASKR